jgi:NADH-quinone oxidoreductase subunit J
MAGAMTIFARNPVHSVLWLIVAFFNAAGLMVLVGAEFIAMLLVIVYVGAVAVLFLFVVMMLDIDFAELRAGFVSYLPLGLLMALVLLAEILLGLGAWKAGPVLGTPSRRADACRCAEYRGDRRLLYTRYIFLFEMAGIVLLVAMIGAIVLTHRARGGVKSRISTEQNRRRPGEAVVVNQPGRGCCDRQLRHASQAGISGTGVGSQLR